MSGEKSDCKYRDTCHFYNIQNMTPSNQRLREIYCVEWPQKRAIYQANATGKSVTIILWPTGKLVK